MRARPADVHRRLRRWYRTHGRDLPWRHTRDPYAIAVSEVMLQQTQVDRVIPKYRAWLKKFPTTKKLAVASLQDVLTLWSGLGYNRRPRMLRDAARQVMAEHAGRWPRTVDGLQALPGFGPYTAAAVAVFSGSVAAPMVDTNIRRLLMRWTRQSEMTVDHLYQLAKTYQPKKQVDLWYHAMMDLGALICRSVPDCAVCPLRAVCPSAHTVRRAPPRRHGTAIPFVETPRYVRGRVVAWFIAHRRTSQRTAPRVIARALQLPVGRVRGALEGLRAEGILQTKKQEILFAS